MMSRRFVEFDREDRMEVVTMRKYPDMPPNCYYFHYARVKGARLGELPLWTFSIFGDVLDLRFMTFAAIRKPRSLDVAAFLVDAFRECAVPAGLYVDIDWLVRSPRMQRFAGECGFQIELLPPSNPRPILPRSPAQAIIEAYVKLIPFTGRTVGLTSLNEFTFLVLKRFELAQQRQSR